MKCFKLTIAAAIFMCTLFIAAPSQAKVEPLDLSIAPPQYGNTEIPQLVQSAPLVPSTPDFSSKLSTASSSFSIWDPQNGEAYNILGTWYVYNNGSWTVGYPIDSNIVILLIAGIAIGIKVILAKNPELKHQLTTRLKPGFA